MAKEKFLSVRQTSERLKLREAVVRTMIREGKLSARRVGYNLIIDERDVEKLATESK